MNLCLIGILAQRWRILFRMIVASHQKAVSLIRAICVLHNYLRSISDDMYVPAGYADAPAEEGDVAEGFWRQNANQSLTSHGMQSRSLSGDGLSVREYLCEHFSAVGSVPWQLDVINRR